MTLVDGIKVHDGFQDTQGRTSDVVLSTVKSALTSSGYTKVLTTGEHRRMSYFSRGSMFCRSLVGSSYRDVGRTDAQGESPIQHPSYLCRVRSPTRRESEIRRPDRFHGKPSPLIHQTQTLTITDTPHTHLHL